MSSFLGTSTTGLHHSLLDGSMTPMGSMFSTSCFSAGISLAGILEVVPLMGFWLGQRSRMSCSMRSVQPRLVVWEWLLFTCRWPKLLLWLLLFNHSTSPQLQ